MNLETITLREIGQKDKTYTIWSYLHVEQKEKRRERNKQTVKLVETESRTGIGGCQGQECGKNRENMVKG